MIKRIQIFNFLSNQRYYKINPKYDTDNTKLSNEPNPYNSLFLYRFIQNVNNTYDL